MNRQARQTMMERRNAWNSTRERTDFNGYLRWAK